MRSEGFRVRAALAACLLAVAGGLALSACGDDTDDGAGAATAQDGGSAVADAQAAVETAMAPRTEEDSQLPTSGPKAVPDKSLISIVCAAAIEGCRAISDAQVEAAEAIGWDARIIDGRGSPAGWNDAIEAAISARPDVIALAAILPSAVSGALERAESQGITVICTQCGAPAGEAGVDASTGDEVNPIVGEYLGNYIVAESDGEANVLMWYYPEFGISKLRHDAAKKVLDACAGCTTESIEVKISEWGTTLPDRVQTLLAQNPDINWIYSPADETAIDAVNAIQAAGRSGEVRVAGGNGNLQALEAIKSDPTYAATSAVSYAFSSWAGIDNANRVLAGEETVETTSPVRLIDQSNSDAIPAGEYYSGDVDFRSAFESIWGGN